MTTDSTPAGAGHRIWTGVRAHATAFFREPLYLLLLVVLPIIEIRFAGSALESLPAAAFTDSTTPLQTTGQLFGAIYATAVLAGIVGLFQRLSADDTDRRLLIAGSTPGRLFLTRLLTVIGITAGVAGISTVSLAWFATVSDPGLVFGVLAVAGAMYAAFGMVAGSILSGELEGSLAIVFLVDLDVVLATGLLPTDATIGTLFPLYYPFQLLEAAVTGAALVGDHVFWSLAYATALGVLAVIVYGRSVALGGAA
jgi:ABC-2 type transport system permease protein